MWLVCTIFNWFVIFQALRNKFTGKTERIPSMMPLVGGICLVFIANLAPSFFSQLPLPAWVGVLILLLDPGSVPYLLLIIIGLPIVSMWHGFAKLINRGNNSAK
jgi:hypothetical protein